MELLAEPASLKALFSRREALVKTLRAFLAETPANRPTFPEGIQVRPRGTNGHKDGPWRGKGTRPRTRMGHGDKRDTTAASVTGARTPSAWVGVLSPGPMALPHVFVSFLRVPFVNVGGIARVRGLQALIQYLPDAKGLGQALNSVAGQPPQASDGTAPAPPSNQVPLHTLLRFGTVCCPGEVRSIEDVL